MAQTEQKIRMIEDRIARLRQRLKDARTLDELRGIMAGILDLLADEL